MLIGGRGSAATTDAEGIFAEVLAEVLRVDRVSVESHFFDELGADSLVMAHFCARVRKRGNLPSVSMKDIYQHPTIRSLAAALADIAPSSAKSSVAAATEVATPTSTLEYVFCGALPLRACALVYRSAHHRRRDGDPQRVVLPRLPGTSRADRGRRSDPRPGRLRRRKGRARHQHVEGRWGAARSRLRDAQRPGGAGRR